MPEVIHRCLRKYSEQAPQAAYDEIAKHETYGAPRAPSDLRISQFCGAFW